MVYSKKEATAQHAAPANGI